MAKMLQVFREGWTALNSKGVWVDLREATQAEVELAAQHGTQFWLPVHGEAYWAPGARQLSDRLARVVEREEPMSLSVSPRGTMRIDMTVGDVNATSLEIITEAGIIHIGTGLVGALTGIPSVELNIEVADGYHRRHGAKGVWISEVKDLVSMGRVDVILRRAGG